MVEHNKQLVTPLNRGVKLGTLNSHLEHVHYIGFLWLI